MNLTLKSLIGETIYLVPTGNNIARRVPIEEQITEATLLKVGRSVATTNLGNYRIDGEWNVHNGGYIHFPTEQAAKEYFLKLSMENYIRDIFRVKTTLTYATLLTIKQLIDKEIK